MGSTIHIVKKTQKGRQIAAPFSLLTRKSLFRTIALSVYQLGPSGGPFLVPPRKGERMRPKGGAVGKAALP